MTSAASSPRTPRPVALVVIDIVASILLLFFAASLALVVITTATAYQGLTAECGSGPFEGITCNGTVLGIVTIGMIVIAVLATFLAVGFVIVNLIRRRYTFYWPVGAIVIMIVATWIGSWIAGMIAP
ncbi:hypothetical protein [Antiquaquibacter soli]|uniref:Uncharacterized protein n=1 Tax=Antiquaquibacter soli TaxID=3064523 RepID=A0ABT9BKQ9_9MICO|nr:hypothetical protein [Protaetiibacter sp. WY-16]MDO7881608.1 hypothetical protein [Protaetiibacter sp. WY-16]